MSFEKFEEFCEDTWKNEKYNSLHKDRFIKKCVNISNIVIEKIPLKHLECMPLTSAFWDSVINIQLFF